MRSTRADRLLMWSKRWLSKHSIKQRSSGRWQWIRKWITRAGGENPTMRNRTLTSTPSRSSKTHPTKMSLGMMINWTIRTPTRLKPSTRQTPALLSIASFSQTCSRSARCQRCTQSRQWPYLRTQPECSQSLSGRKMNRMSRCTPCRLRSSPLRRKSAEGKISTSKSKKLSKIQMDSCLPSATLMMAYSASGYLGGSPGVLPRSRSLKSRLMN